MTVIYNTNFTHNPNSYLTLAVLDAARQLFGAENVELADNRSLAPIAARGEHELLICLDGQRLHQGLLRRVRRSFRSMALWLFEDPFMLDYNVQNIDLFDAIFTNDPACVGQYGGKGHYLPLAASRRFHFRPVRKDGELEYDIFFAGTMWPNRIQSLRRIVNAFPHARLKLVCPTNEYLPPLPSDLARLAIQWPISHESFIDFANASRVTLTMFRDYASHGDVGQATAPGPRLYELGLAGTAQVVECGDAMEQRHFDALGGVDVVRDPGDLVRAVRRLLETPTLRAERAHEAQQQVSARQLYTHRLQIIRGVTGADVTRRPATSPLPAAAGSGSRRMRVLMCTHSTIHRNEWGGVEVYQQTLVAMFEREIEVFFWLRRDGQCQLMDDKGTVLERFDMHDIGWLDSLTDAPEEMAFSNVLGEYGFDLVHFQHLGHHTASLPIIAKAAGVGTVFSAHDFFLVCSRYNLLNHEQVFCDIGNKSISACDICLRIAENLPAGVQQTRRAFMVEVIRSIDVLLFGTAYSEQLTRRIYPELERRRSVVLGIPMPSGTIIDTPPERVEQEDTPLVVAVVGNFLRSKGADTIMSIIEEANPLLFRFHLLGNADPAYAEVFARWNKPNVVYHGRYAPGDLTSVAQADVALHLSIWPETYCISMSEIWQAGLIPVVSDIGAFHDRVEHGVNGFKVRVGDTSAVLDTLELLRADPRLRRTMRGHIGPHLWTEHREYATRLLELYRSVAPRRPLGNVGLGLDTGQVHLLPHPSWKTLAPPRHIFDPSRRSTVRLELPPQIQDWSHVQGSEVYIDSVCGVTPDLLEAQEFEPRSELAISGWTFVPGIQLGGQVTLALVGDAGGPIIFVPASRDIRDDIMGSFPGAPRRSGFTGQITLRGKWCEGAYQVALITGFGDRAAFCLTALKVTIEAGQVTGAIFAPPSNEAIIQAFYRVSCQTGEDPALPLARLKLPTQAWTGEQTLQHHIDTVCGVEKRELEQASLPAAILQMRGWAFGRGSGLAGRLYVGLVETSTGQTLFLPAQREVRGDLSTYFADAPLCGGFSVALEIAPSLPAGRYACVLVNVVGASAASLLTDLELVVADGQLVAVEAVEQDPRRTEQTLARLRGARTGSATAAPSPVGAPLAAPAAAPVAALAPQAVGTPVRAAKSDAPARDRRRSPVRT